MFLMISRTFREALKSLFRNGWLSVATVSILILSLYVVSVLYVVTHTTDKILKDIQNKITVSVYFKPDVAEADILAAKSDLEKNGQIASADYVSRDQALADFKRENADEPVILQSLDELGDNPLLASLVIKANNSDQYQAVSDYIKQTSYKDEISRINYDKGNIKDVISRLNSIDATTRRIGLVLSLILVVISILITFNTIMITIYAQRREIEIMRLVGASNTFIRLPFVFEGIIYGVIAALVSMLILFITLKFLTPYVSSVVSPKDTVDFYTSHFFQIFGLQLLIGIILGIISSLVAMRRYLKI